MACIDSQVPDGKLKINYSMESSIEVPDGELK
jgi:hypothetical protein